MDFPLSAKFGFLRLNKHKVLKMENTLKKGKTKMDIAVIYILISVITGAIGQVMLKKGMTNLGPLTLSTKELPTLIGKIALNPFIVIGLAIYVGGIIFWLVALSRVDLSFAYPFASLSYVLMMFASWIFLKEEITLIRLAGSLVIVVGVWIVSRG
jgi:drug/metabolite transporter (DMT)-like permease